MTAGFFCDTFDYTEIQLDVCRRDAEAFYGVPSGMEEERRKRLQKDILAGLDWFERAKKARKGQDFDGEMQMKKKIYRRKNALSSFCYRR